MAMEAVIQRSGVPEKIIRRGTRGGATKILTVLSKNDCGNNQKVAEDGVIFALFSTPCLVDGTILATNEVVMASRLTFDTCFRFNIINKSSVTPGWEHHNYANATPSRINDENGRRLELSE